MSTSVSPVHVTSESEPTVSVPLTRRGFLGGGLAVAGAAGTALIAPLEGLAQTAAHGPAPAVSKRKVFSSDEAPIVETQYGKVRGSIRNGIYTFKGVPYGADTGGANRWMMAKKPAPAGTTTKNALSITGAMAFRAKTS